MTLWSEDQSQNIMCPFPFKDAVRLSEFLQQFLFLFDITSSPVSEWTIFRTINFGPLWLQQIKGNFNEGYSKCALA